jgi:hypothetical protein
MISRRGSRKANNLKRILKAPSTKHQAPEKLQAPNFMRKRWSLGFDVWSFSGAWCLVLEISSKSAAP